MRVLAHGDPRLYPAIEILGGERGCELVLVGNAVSEKLDSQGISFKNLESYINDPVKSQVAQALPFYLERITAAWREVGRRLGEASEPTQVIAALDDQLREALRQSLVEEMLLIEAFKACNSERPVEAVCLLDDFPRPFRTLTRAAQRSKVPVLHVAHGIYFHGEGRKLAADAIAVGGSFNQLNLPSLGFERERIFVTGNPAWDYYSRLPEVMPPAREIKERLGLDPRTPLLLYCSTWSDNKDWLAKLRAGFGALLQALKSAGLRGAHVLVKLHPFGDGDASAYTQAAGLAGFSDVSFSTDYKELLVWAADLVVLETASSLMAESTLLRRPVVILMSEAEKRYLFSGVGWPADALVTCPPEPSRLAPVISDLLQGGELAKAVRCLIPATIEKFNLANDGQAARRVVSLLMELARPAATAAC